MRKQLFKSEKSMLSIIKHIIVTLLIIQICLSQRSQIFIDYGVGGQGRQLMKFFSDVKNQFYVDIGSYDPVFASNTLNLYSQGWDGINIDANPQRVNRFFLMRPDQTNLNFAIGQQDVYSTLYQLDEDSSSTISTKVKDFVAGYKPVVSELKVPSLSLKQLCERFYYRKPIFMNLDVEGYGGRVLETNDWTNPKCVPQFIISQINQQITRAGLPIPGDILKKNGYIKLNYIVGLNEIYIHDSVYKLYLQRQKTSKSYRQSMKYLDIMAVSSVLGRYLKTYTTLIKHYSPTTDPMAHKFTKFNEAINLNTLNEWHNDLLAESPTIKKNRPILIYHFNPKNNLIIIRQGSRWVTNKLQLEGFTFYEIFVTDSDGTQFRAYILDHYYNGTNGLSPIILDESKDAKNLQQKQYTATKKQVTPAKQLSTDQKTELQVIKTISAQVAAKVKNQSDLLSRLQQGQQNQTDQLRSVFLNNHNFQINLLQRISMKVQQLERISRKERQIMGKNRDSSGKVKSTKIVVVQSQIDNLQVVQKIMLALTLIMSVSLCVTVCITSRQKFPSQALKHRPKSNN